MIISEVVFTAYHVTKIIHTVQATATNCTSQENQTSRPAQKLC